MSSVERWLPVLGWEGLYEVSDQGRVRSVDRIIATRDGRSRRYRSRLLAVRRADSGHLKVDLNAPGRRRQTFVHVLVAEAFLGPRPDGQEVRHYPDPDPTNNRPENLRWGTRSDNNADAVEHGTHFQSGKTRCPDGHLYSPENTRVTKAGRRECITCQNRRNREYKARRRAQRAHA